MQESAGDSVSLSLWSRVVAGAKDADEVRQVPNALCSGDHSALGLDRLKNGGAVYQGY